MNISPELMKYLNIFKNYMSEKYFKLYCEEAHCFSNYLKDSDFKNVRDAKYE